MKLIPILLIFFILSCGKSKSNQTQTPFSLPTNMAAESESRAPKSYPYNCGPVDEVQGGNFDFFWSFPRPGEIEELKLDPEKKFLQVKYLGTDDGYTSKITRIANSFESGDYRATIPSLPSGTIRGRKKEYTIVELYIGENEINKFLCPIGLREKINP
jgi:hypothetical protein